jgi:hypothetical protein
MTKHTTIYIILTALIAVSTFMYTKEKESTIKYKSRAIYLETKLKETESQYDNFKKEVDNTVNCFASDLHSWNMCYAFLQDLYER